MDTEMIPVVLHGGPFDGRLLELETLTESIRAPFHGWHVDYFRTDADDDGRVVYQARTQ